MSSEPWVWSELPDGTRISSTPNQETPIRLSDGREATLSGPMSICFSPHGFGPDEEPSRQASAEGYTCGNFSKDDAEE